MALNSFRVVFKTTTDTGPGETPDCVYSQLGLNKFFSYDWGEGPQSIEYDDNNVGAPSLTAYAYHGYDARTLRDVAETYGIIGQDIGGIGTDFSGNNKLVNHACMESDDPTRTGIKVPSSVYQSGDCEGLRQPVVVDSEFGTIDNTNDNEYVGVVYDDTNDATKDEWPKYIYLAGVGAGAYGQGCITSLPDTECQDGCGDGHICATVSDIESTLFNSVNRKGGDGSQGSVFLKVCADSDRETLTIISKVGLGGVKTFRMIDDVVNTASFECLTSPRHESNTNNPHGAAGSYTTFPSQDERETWIKVYEGTDINDDNLVMSMHMPGGEPPRLDDTGLVGPSIKSATDVNCNNADTLCAPNCDEGNGKNGTDIAPSTNVGFGSIIVNGPKFNDEKYSLHKPRMDQGPDTADGTAYNEHLRQFKISNDAVVQIVDHKSWHQASMQTSTDCYITEELDAMYVPGIGGNGDIQYWNTAAGIDAAKSGGGFTGEGAGGNGGTVYVGYGPEFTFAAENDPPSIDETGACCSDGDCSDNVTEDECVKISGTWLGSDTTCEDQDCSNGGPESIWEDISVALTEMNAAIGDSGKVNFGTGANTRRNFIKKTPTASKEAILNLQVDSEPVEHDVSITVDTENNQIFSPSEITVNPGDTVIWSFQLAAGPASVVSGEPNSNGTCGDGELFNSGVREQSQDSEDFVWVVPTDLEPQTIQYGGIREDSVGQGDTELICGMSGTITVDSNLTVDGGLFSAGVPLEFGWVSSTVGENIKEYDWTSGLVIDLDSRIIDETTPGQESRVDIVRADLQHDSTHDPSLITLGATETLDANWTTLFDDFGRGPNGISTLGNGNATGQLDFDPATGFLSGFTITDTELVSKATSLINHVRNSAFSTEDSETSNMLVNYWVEPDTCRTALLSVDDTSPVTHVVEISNFEFSPSSITVKPGDTVKWVMAEDGFHNVQFVSSTDGEYGGWDTGALMTTEDQSFEVSNFDGLEPQTISYQCGIHGGSMVGTIVVEAAATSGVSVSADTVKFTFQDLDSTVTSESTSYFLFTFSGHRSFLLPDATVFGTNPTTRRVCAFHNTRFADQVGGKLYYKMIERNTVPGPKTRVQYHHQGLNLGAGDGSTVKLVNVLVDGTASGDGNEGNIFISDGHAGIFRLYDSLILNGYVGVGTSRSVSSGVVKLHNSVFKATSDNNVGLRTKGTNGHEVYRCTFGPSDNGGGLLIETGPNNIIHECIFGNLNNKRGNCLSLSAGSEWGSRVYDNLFINSPRFNKSGTLNNYLSDINYTVYDYLVDYNNVYYADSGALGAGEERVDPPTWNLVDENGLSDWSAEIVLVDGEKVIQFSSTSPIRKLWGLVEIRRNENAADDGGNQSKILFEEYMQNGILVTNPASRFFDQFGNSVDEGDMPWISIGDDKLYMISGLVSSVDMTIIFNLQDEMTIAGVLDSLPVGTIDGTFIRPLRDNRLIQEFNITMANGIQHESIDNVLIDKPAIAMSSDIVDISNGGTGKISFESGLYAQNYGAPFEDVSGIIDNYWKWQTDDGLIHYVLEAQVTRPLDAGSSWVGESKFIFPPFNQPNLFTNTRVSSTVDLLEGAPSAASRTFTVIINADGTHTDPNGNDLDNENDSFDAWVGDTIEWVNNSDVERRIRDIVCNEPTSAQFIGEGNGNEQLIGSGESFQWTIPSGYFDDNNFVICDDAAPGVCQGCGTNWDVVGSSLSIFADSDSLYTINIFPDNSAGFKQGDMINIKVFETPSGTRANEPRTSYHVSGAKLRMVNNSFYNTVSTNNFETGYGTFQVDHNSLEYHMQNNVYTNGVQKTAGGGIYDGLLFSDFNIAQIQKEEISDVFFSGTDLPYSTEYWVSSTATDLELNPVTITINGNVDIYDPETSGYQGEPIGHLWKKNGNYLTIDDITATQTATSFFSDSTLELNTPTVESEDHPRWFEQSTADDSSGFAVDDRPADTSGALAAADFDVFKLPTITDHTVSGTTTFRVEILGENIDKNRDLGGKTPLVKVGSGSNQTMALSTLKKPSIDTPLTFTLNDGVSVWFADVTLTADTKNTITVSSSTESISFDVYHATELNQITISNDLDLQTNVRGALSSTNPGLDVINIGHSIADLGSVLDGIDPTTFTQIRDRWLVIKPQSSDVSVTWKYDSGVGSHDIGLDWLAFEGIVFGSDSSDNGGGSWLLSGTDRVWFNKCEFRGQYNLDSDGWGKQRELPVATVPPVTVSDQAEQYFTQCYFDSTSTGKLSLTDNSPLVRDCAFVSQRGKLSENCGVMLNCQGDKLVGIASNSGGVHESIGVNFFGTHNGVVVKGVDVQGPLASSFYNIIDPDTGRVYKYRGSDISPLTFSPEESVDNGVPSYTNFIIDEFVVNNGDSTSETPLSLSATMTNTRISDCSFSESTVIFDFSEPNAFTSNGTSEERVLTTEHGVLTTTTGGFWNIDDAGLITDFETRPDGIDDHLRIVWSAPPFLGGAGFLRLVDVDGNVIACLEFDSLSPDSAQDQLWKAVSFINSDGVVVTGAESIDNILGIQCTLQFAASSWSSTYRKLVPTNVRISDFNVENIEYVDDTQSIMFDQQYFVDNNEDIQFDEQIDSSAITNEIQNELLTQAELQTTNLLFSNLGIKVVTVPVFSRWTGSSSGELWDTTGDGANFSNTFAEAQGFLSSYIVGSDEDTGGVYLRFDSTENRNSFIATNEQIELNVDVRDQNLITRVDNSYRYIGTVDENPTQSTEARLLSTNIDGMSYTQLTPAVSHETQTNVVFASNIGDFASQDVNVVTTSTDIVLGTMTGVRVLLDNTIPRVEFTGLDIGDTVQYARIRNADTNEVLSVLRYSAFSANEGDWKILTYVDDSGITREAVDSKESLLGKTCTIEFGVDSFVTQFPVANLELTRPEFSDYNLWGDNPKYSFIKYIPPATEEQRTVTQILGETTFTWVFDQVPDEVGTFIDGSPWVVLPDNTKLISTSPLPTSDTNVSPALFTNGVGINPTPGNEVQIVDGDISSVTSTTNTWNTFDSRTGNFNSSQFITNRDSLAVDGDGILVGPEDVIVLTDSFDSFDPESGRKTPIRHQAVLSVVSSDVKPDSDSFRPPIHWSSIIPQPRPIFSAADISLNAIAAINEHTNVANFSLGGANIDLDDILIGPIIQHSDSDTYSAAIAQFNVLLDGGESSLTEAETFVPLLNYFLNQITLSSISSGIDQSDRLRHLKRLVQYGIDCYGAISTLGDLGSLDATKAGMLKQWALFALFVIDKDENSIDDVLTDLWAGWSLLDDADKTTIKSRLFNEDRVLQELLSVTDGRANSDVSYSIISGEITVGVGSALFDRSTKTPYVYGQDSPVDYNEVTLSSGFPQNPGPVAHYSDLIGTRLVLTQDVLSSDHDILMVTDQFEVSDYNTTTFEHELGFIGPIPGLPVPDALSYFCSESTSTFLNDWGITTITIDTAVPPGQDEASLDTYINFGANGEAAANYVLEQKPRIEFNGVPIQYNGDQSDGLSNRPARVVVDQESNSATLELPTAFNAEEVNNIIVNNVTTVSFARPFKIWFNPAISPSSPTGSVTFESFMDSDVGGAFFFNGEASNATASAFNSNIAQKCGRAWLPTYVALSKLYGDDRENLGIVNKWINAYIFGINGVPTRDLWVLKNNAENTFGKLESPAAFDDSNANGWLTD